MARRTDELTGSCGRPRALSNVADIPCGGYAAGMGKRTADDAARALLFTTTSEREAAVQALLARNAPFRTNDELIAEELRTDAGFRDEWQRTTPGRVVATGLVRYRAEHNLSQRALADRLRMTLSEVARLELGEVNPSGDTLTRLSEELGIGVTLDGEPSPQVE